MFSADNTSGGARRTLSFAAALAAAAIISIPPAPTQDPSWNPSSAPYEVEEDEGVVANTAERDAPAVEATFLRQSYRPGTIAKLVLWRSEPSVTVQIFHAGPEDTRTVGNITMQGVPMGRPVRLGARRAHTPIGLSIGHWPSGLYFARLSSRDGRTGFAPFVVRPTRLGEHRVAVVLPTYTWQAYNWRDDNADGRADTWYDGWEQQWAPLVRPFMYRGVPLRFRGYDLPFLHWLARTKRSVDYLSDEDLGAVGSARRLRAAYDLIVFPGHHEYVTLHEYDLVEGYRDRGGHLAFLSADDFDWQIVLRHGLMIRTARFRDLGRPQAALIGVQYIGTDGGLHHGPWLIRRAETAPWLFAGMGLENGSRLGSGGIELDHTAPSSPRGIRVLAEIPDLFGPGFTGQMTYYETARGARVFAAGAFTIAGSAMQPPVRKLLENLWTRLTESGRHVSAA
jgi:hypothetical protein